MLQMSDVMVCGICHTLDVGAISSAAAIIIVHVQNSAEVYNCTSKYGSGFIRCRGMIERGK